MIWIFFIQSVSMAGLNHFRLTVDMVIMMLFEEQDEEDEEAILGLDSEDPDYVLQDQAGVVGWSWNPVLLNQRRTNKL